MESTGSRGGTSPRVRPRNGRRSRGGPGRVRWLATDVDVHAATLGRPSCAAGVAAVELAAAAPARRASRRRPPAGPGRPPRPAGEPARRGHMRVGRQVDCPGRRCPREPVHAAAERHGGHLVLSTCTVPAKPPVAPLHSRRHQPVGAARREPAHPARRRAALRCAEGQGGGGRGVVGPRPACAPADSAGASERGLRPWGDGWAVRSPTDAKGRWHRVGGNIA